MTEEPTSSYTAPASPISGAPTASPPEQSVSLPQGGEPSGAPTQQPPALPQGLAWDKLPKAWKKDMESHWSTLPEPVRQYVHSREQQILDGIRGYARGHDNWNRLVEPYQQILAQNPNIDPVELMSGLARNHLILVQGTAEQKRALYKHMAQHYGITQEEAKELAQSQTGQTPAAPAPAPAGDQGFSPKQLQALQSMLGPILQPIQQQRLQEVQTKVDAFFSDPKNKYSEEVAEDMLGLFRQGRATDLPEAYEMAVMRNPAIKAKYLADLAESAQPSGPGPSTTNIKSSTTPATPAAPGSIDDTFKAVLKKHYG